jgi:hypothetical protein
MSDFASSQKDAVGDLKREVYSVKANPAADPEYPEAQAGAPAKKDRMVHNSVFFLIFD